MAGRAVRGSGRRRTLGSSGEVWIRTVRVDVDQLRCLGNGLCGHDQPIRSVDGNVCDGKGALDGSSVLTLYKRIIPHQRFLSKRPIDGFQHQTNNQPCTISSVSGEGRPNETMFDSNLAPPSRSVTCVAKVSQPPEAVRVIVFQRFASQRCCT